MKKLFIITFTVISLFALPFASVSADTKPTTDFAATKTYVGDSVIVTENGVNYTYLTAYTKPGDSTTTCLYNVADNSASAIASTDPKCNGQFVIDDQSLNIPTNYTLDKTNVEDGTYHSIGHYGFSYYALELSSDVQEISFYSDGQLITIPTYNDNFALGYLYSQEADGTTNFLEGEIYLSGIDASGIANGEVYKVDYSNFNPSTNQYDLTIQLTYNDPNNSNQTISQWYNLSWVKTQNITFTPTTDPTLVNQSQTPPPTNNNDNTKVVNGPAAANSTAILLVSASVIVGATLTYKKRK